MEAVKMFKCEYAEKCNSSICKHKFDEIKKRIAEVKIRHFEKVISERVAIVAEKEKEKNGK